MGNYKPQPFSSFGQVLKKLRHNLNETQSEVSGAVEIDQESLKSYELGETRPTEDVLLLLIQHFSLEGAEASELWRLAGYGDTPMDEAQYFANDDFGQARATYAHKNAENEPIVYTDMIQVMVNNYGVVMNFMQGAGTGSNGSPLAVARIGMSKEHAKSVIEVLKMTLEQAHELEKKAVTPRQLPAGKKKQG